MGLFVVTPSRKRDVAARGLGLADHIEPEGPLDFSPLARGPARGLLACHVTEIKIMNALEVAQGEPNRGGIMLGPTATWEIPDSRTQGSERDENFAPFHIKTLDRGPSPISKKSEFKGGMICVNL